MRIVTCCMPLQQLELGKGRSSFAPLPSPLLFSLSLTPPTDVTAALLLCDALDYSCLQSVKMGWTQGVCVCVYVCVCVCVCVLSLIHI